MDTLVLIIMFLKKMITIFLPGFIAIVLGFVFYYPKTGHEAVLRILVTILFSVFIGPISITVVHTVFPSLFDSAKYLSESNVLIYSDAFLVMPILILASLPAWWITGAICRFWEKKKNKDIGEILEDVIVLKDKIQGKEVKKDIKNES